MTYIEAYNKLEKNNQLQLLDYYDKLSNQEQEELLNQIEDIDFSIFDNLYKNKSLSHIDDIKVLKIKDIDINKDRYEKIGLDMLKRGKVGSVILAGGMGTRLGVSYPKGMYDIGINKSKYIFECLFDNILEIVRKTDTWLEIFIMTSEKNHKQTVDFLEEHNYFGYKKEYVHFFVQKTLITTDFYGKILMENESKLALSPNGNGGWYKSLFESDIYEVVKQNEIEWLNVVSVDNVLQKIFDPCFIGATIDSKCNVGTKVVEKLDGENVGVVCSIENTPSVIEYYEIEKMDIDSQLKEKLRYGVTLNYLFNVNKLNEIKDINMPIHRVKKKIKHMNDRNSSEVNGYKYETLATDLVKLLETCLPFEVVREEEFAPIKNLKGKDSVESARTMLEEKGIEL